MWEWKCVQRFFFFSTTLSLVLDHGRVAHEILQKFQIDAAQNVAQNEITPVQMELFPPKRTVFKLHSRPERAIFKLSLSA